jgi:hypothetical protein
MSQTALAIALLMVMVACRSSAPPPKETAEKAFIPYRLTDHFSPASVTTASSAPSSVLAAQPVIWRFNEQKVTWQSLRGRMGFKKPGLLVVKGDGSTPVIAAPNNPAIDWSLYEAVKIRMISEGGTEIKVKLGSQEMRQKLAPPMEWMVYQFAIPTVPSGFIRPMAIMPTDDLFAAAAFDFIELVPRKETLGAPAGLTTIGKLDEYRSALFSRAPASIAFDIPIPAGGPVLHFGLGVAGRAPVTFRVLVGPGKTELFSKQVSDPDRWEDAETDLSAYAGTTAHIILESASSATGRIHW